MFVHRYVVMILCLRAILIRLMVLLNEMSTTLLESRSSSPSSKIQRSLELILFVRTDDMAKISNH